SALVAFLAGAASVLAFAPVGFHPLLLVTLALLIHLWGPASPRQCFFLGFWFGLGFFCAGVSWIYVSLSEFGGMQPVLAGIATLAGIFAVSFLTAAAAGLVWCIARGQRRTAAATALVALLVVGEALRHVEWTEPQGEPFDVALLQGNVRQELKFKPERYAEIV